MKPHLKFDNQERSGIFFLLLLIIMLIGAYFGLKFFAHNRESSFRFDEKTQLKIDSLKSAINEKDSTRIFPFNPNYISDYKGYTLGLSPDEIDRLHSFRVQKKFVNSAQEFQEVTRVSDSLLGTISPYFKFPDWVNSKDERTIKRVEKDSEISVGVSDLNSATIKDLKEINGIGDVLSARIVKFRNRLGGFLVNEQLYDVYGLERGVENKVLNNYKVLNPPKIKRININTASVEELSSLVYISRELAQNIVSYRNRQGNFTNLDDLLNISGYPQNKNERIKLYLSI
ncbi:ComEA family DNA-binding protein [Croceivirga thetidis]|uniref:Helix-hairpin-helix domain-containing protein n=1 Tax=Croceivirga thetidis TaxID=2721623 RepID=A0ABX1GTY2_9FLAO|nr:helix-hairpin-helix domain-containing protein [Croceivirga thetidis]NKI33414.1 helix-hairpin-helix domain-containing protein [Croceivirga thetidis]